MTQKELNELASDKINSKLQVLLREDMEELGWKVSRDTIKAMVESHQREVKIWSYIFQLIEQNNKL